MVHPIYPLERQMYDDVVTNSRSRHSHLSSTSLPFPLADPAWTVGGGRGGGGGGAEKGRG